jgi:hypothetical protein
MSVLESSVMMLLDMLACVSACARVCVSVYARTHTREAQARRCTEGPALPWLLRTRAVALLAINADKHRWEACIERE